MALDPPGDIGTAIGRPSSILLAQQAYVVASRNETTAAAKSRCDRRFVLLRTRFASGDGEYEYFLYKGDVKSPSLECIPLPEDCMLDGVNEFGILPRGDTFLLVGFYDGLMPLDYDLRIYSSEDKTWRTEKLLNPCPDVGIIIPEKVITLGEGVLGMVDFRRGMLVINLLQKSPVARYIPLPEPLPENTQKLQIYSPSASPRRFRDLACSDGVIKFIEMEHRVIVKETREIAPEKPKNPIQNGVLHDSELIWRQTQKVVESKTKMEYLMNGWWATTWTREMESDFWLPGCSIDVDDILVEDSFSKLLSGQSDDANLLFKNLNSAWPILSTDGDDILYLKSLPEFRGSNGWVVAVDLAKKTLKAEERADEAHSLGRYIPSQQIFHPCTLSKHLNITPAYSGCFLFSEIGAVGFLLSAEEVNRAENGAQSIVQNARILNVVEPDSCETENKSPRLSAEKDNLPQNGAQSVVQNAHILSAPPDQCSQPPHMCGYSWWPLESNLPPQQSFNKWGGSTPVPCCHFQYEASSHGYSHEFTDCELYAYGSRPDYGSYQLQSQQCPPIQELPAYAPLQQPLVQLQHQG
nr:unnamed protein product [Digitaria exilis]